MVLLVALALLRVLYHANYLAEVPFALATFSDGRQYELAARDLLAHPPLGSRPFYLQGLYAYQMALPMALRGWVSFALLFQLLLCGLTHAWFFRAIGRWRGRRAAAWATATLLAFPMVAFYENKFLTASLAITASVGVLAAAIGVQRRPDPRRWGLLGVAVGVAVLARPNFVLLVPVLAWACWRPVSARWGRVGSFALGLALVLGPMAVRNQVVTGRATVFPAHGGGTSFYIGNNAEARGVWNDARGLLTGDVSKERDELRAALGVASGSEADEIAAIGRALYRRGLSEIVDAPGHWAWLEVRKAWLMLGNDELAQDYDVYGERELLWCSPRFGLPFGVAVAFAVFGVGRLRGTGVVGWALVGLVVSTLAANLLYFTSAQHRLPLLVPVAVAFPLGVARIREAVRARHWLVLTVFAGLLVATGWPRTHKRSPSAAHHYNLAVAWLYVGQPREAIGSLDRALELKPDHVVIRLERAKLLRERGFFERARDDLDALERQGGLPPWVRARVEHERRILRSWGL